MEDTGGPAAGGMDTRRPHQQTMVREAAGLGIRCGRGGKRGGNRGVVADFVEWWEKNHLLQ